MKKAGGKGGYVPSFIPPGMAAAVAGASGGGGGDKRDNPEKKEEASAAGARLPACCRSAEQAMLSSQLPRVGDEPQPNPDPCCRPRPPARLQSLFQPPSSNRGKVRSIDLLLQNLKK